MKLQLKNSLTLDTDQVSCSEAAKSFIKYAFTLNGMNVKPDFDSAMMRFAHAFEDVVRKGKLDLCDGGPVELTVACVPEAIAALADAYPELAIRQTFAKWFNCCNCIHARMLPRRDWYMTNTRVAVCWWDERMIRPGARREANAENVDELLARFVQNYDAINEVYADFLDKFATHVEATLRDARVCVIHSHVDWLVKLTNELDAKLGELGEGSGGTWYITEEIMKVTHTRVVATERDCEYIEIFPGKYLTGDFTDEDIFHACERQEYGKFISHEEFISDK